MRVLDSNIKTVAEEFDFNWRDMAYEIITLREKIEIQEREITDLQKETK